MSQPEQTEQELFEEYQQALREELAARQAEQASDEVFVDQLAEKFPQLKAWPGKDQK